MENKIKKITGILLIFVALFIFITVSIFLKFGTVAGDDTCEIFFANDIFYELTHPDHGRYLAWLQIKIIGSVLPFMLNIHPQEFINNFSNYIRGLDIVFLCFSIAGFFYIKRKVNIEAPFLILFSFLYYSILVMKHSIIEICNLTTHYGYQFGLFLYILFIIIFSKYYLAEQKSETKDSCPFSLANKISVLIFSFISALNDSFAICGIISILVFSIISFKSYKIKSHILFPIIGFVLGAVISVYGLSLDSHIMDFVDNPSASNKFLYWADMIYKFIPKYMVLIIFKYWYYHVLIILLSVLLIKKKEINIVILSSSFYLGILGFFVSLICGGTDSFYIKGLFWINHNDLHIILQINLLCISLSLLGAFLSSEYNKYLKNIIVFLYCIMFFSLILPVKDTFYAYKQMYQTGFEVRQNAYIGEKMYLFYLYKNKPAYLPIELLSYHEIASSFWVGMPGEIFEIYDIYECNIHNPEWKDREKITNEISAIKIDNVCYINSYINNVYKQGNKVPMYLIESEKAYDLFKEEGGSFTDSELENLDFTKLYDKNFVLNI